jgi:hypothetical protein
MPHALSTRAFGQPITLPFWREGKSVPHFAQVSELAYQLWKKSGFAAGSELEYWYEAEQRLWAAEAVEDQPSSDRLHRLV